MSTEIVKLISEEEIKAKIKEIAGVINKDYEGKDLHLICVLKGGVFFYTELAKEITIPVTFDFISVRSYESATETTGLVNIMKDLEDPIEGRDVLLVEDIVDSGYTLRYLMELFKSRNPASVKLCTLLNKHSRRIVDIEPEYSCFDVTDVFVVGYGLDYDQKYRNLPYIGYLNI